MVAARTAIARQNPPRTARREHATEKPKTVVSTTTLFKKPTNPSQTCPNPILSVKQPRAIHATAPSVLKKPNRTPRKAREHPLLVAFTDSSTTYRTTLLSEAAAFLDEVHKGLLLRLDDTTDSPRVAEHTELIKQLTLPLDTEALAIAEQVPSASSASLAFKPTQMTMTLGRLMDDFRRVVAREAQILSDLEKEHRALLAQLTQLAGAPSTLSESSFRERVRELREEIEAAGRDAVVKMEREEAEASRGRKEMRRQILGIFQAQL